MTHRIPCFHKIRDFSAFQIQLNSYSPKQPLGKFLAENTTQTSDKNILTQRKTRSIKNRNKNPELSFEKDFILEHIEAFNFMIEKYLEQMFEDITVSVSGFKNHQLFPKKTNQFNHPNVLEGYLRSGDSLLGNNQTQMFMEDLSYQQKLYEFLTYVCNMSCDQVAFQLIYIGNMVWQEYIKIQDRDYDYQQLIEYAKNLVESFSSTLRSHNSIRFFTLQNTFLQPTIQSAQKQAKIKEIVYFFIATIFLILSQHFGNPFYSAKLQNQLQRHIFFNNINSIDSDQAFSEDQDSEQFQFISKGKKKVKISTPSIE